jgi:propanol-preferring alcohol dehydrogenase
MRAMILQRPGQPLAEAELSVPRPGPHEIVLDVRACGVCRTDLHVLDGELPNPKLPLVLGHEVVGTVAAHGERADRFALGTRVGVPWLGRTCGVCPYCTSGRENLCRTPQFTGYLRDGGYAEQIVADERYCFAIPDTYEDRAAAPLLCAGLIGFRSLRKAGNARRLGLYGFGASAHLIAQLAVYEGREVYAFTRADDVGAQQFARSLGAVWAGSSSGPAPEPLDAAIIFAPAGELVPAALRAVAPGGVVVCAGIHMSDIPSFPYEILWEERTICSVANLTRQDGEEFMRVAPRVPVRTTVVPFPLARANDALERLRRGQIEGAAVLIP